MNVPILKQGAYLIVSVQSELGDGDWRKLQAELLSDIRKFRSRGVIVDVGSLELMDSFAARCLGNIVKMARLEGAVTKIAGIRPEAALAMVQLGLTRSLKCLETARDLEDALEQLDRALPGYGRHGR